MKKLSLSILLMLALILSVGIFTASADLGTDPIATGIACVNQDAVDGNFQIDFFDSAGTLVTSLTNQSITANGSALYFTTSITGLPSGFKGSAVVSADVNIACSVNTQTISGTTRIGTSNGVSSTETGSPIYAPQILNDLGGFDSVFAVQNTDAAASASVTIKYFDATGAEVFNYTTTIPANSSRIFDQAADEDGDGNLDLPSNFIGSATAESSTTSLAGTVIMSNAGDSDSTAQYLAYNAASTGGMLIHAPRVAKNLSGVGYTSGFSCQNIGTGTTDITADFTVLDKNKNTVTAQMNKTNLGSGQSWGLYLGGTGNSTLDALDQFFGSARFTSTNENIICTVNEDNRTTYAGQGSTYNGIPDGTQSNTVFFAQIVDLGSASFQGGFQIVNTTATDATCTYIFTNASTGNVDTVSSQSLTANNSNSVFVASLLTVDPGSFNGSAVVTCDQPILGIYNLTGFSLTGDPFITNTGINQ